MQLKYCIARIIPLCVTWSYSRLMFPSRAPGFTIFLYAIFQLHFTWPFINLDICSGKIRCVMHFLLYESLFVLGWKGTYILNHCLNILTRFVHNVFVTDQTPIPMDPSFIIDWNGPRIIPLCVTWSYSRLMFPSRAPGFTIFLFSSFLPAITVGLLFPSRSSGLTLGF
jgi:hypothetical protein